MISKTSYPVDLLYNEFSKYRVFLGVLAAGTVSTLTTIQHKSAIHQHNKDIKLNCTIKLEVE